MKKYWSFSESNYLHSCTGFLSKAVAVVNVTPEVSFWSVEEIRAGWNDAANEEETFRDHIFYFRHFIKCNF